VRLKVVELYEIIVLQLIQSSHLLTFGYKNEYMHTVDVCTRMHSIKCP